MNIRVCTLAFFLQYSHNVAARHYCKGCDFKSTLAWIPPAHGFHSSKMSSGRIQRLPFTSFRSKSNLFTYLMTASEAPPVFDENFREKLKDLMVWRRDVRRFKTDPVPANLLDNLLDIAQLAPSVGNSQPWRWISVESPALREAMRENFRRCNAEALAEQTSPDRAALYARLKLSGMDKAPVQLACFCDTASPQVHIHVKYVRMSSSHTYACSIIRISIHTYVHMFMYVRISIYMCATATPLCKSRA
jgi:hypothetical protein